MAISVVGVTSGAPSGANPHQINVQKPAGTTKDDVLCVFIQHAPGVSSVTSTDGSVWGEPSFVAGASSNAFNTFCRVAGSSEPSSYNFATASSSFPIRTWICIAFRGVDPNSILGSSGDELGAGGAGSTAIGFSNITTLANDALVIHAAASVADIAFSVTPPSGATERAEISNNSATTKYNLEVSSVEKTIAGSYSSSSATPSTTLTAYYSFTFALRPLPTVTQTIPIEKTEDDGYVRRESATTEWPLTGAYFPYDFNGISAGEYYGEGNGKKNSYVGLLRFKTHIPSSATILSARLRLTVTSADNSSRALRGEWFNWTPPIAQSHWTSSGSSSAFLGQALSTLGDNTTYYFDLSSPNANIVKGGFTGIRLHGASTDPLTGSHNIQFYAFENNVPNFYPALEITYTLPSYEEEVLLDNPVGYWRLGESGVGETTAADSSGNNLHGSYVNTPTLGVSGAISDNAAVTLNGTDEYISVPDANILDVGDVFSYEIWLKRGSLNSSSSGRLGDKRGASGGAFMILLNPDGAISLWAGSAIATSTTTINDTTTWHHIVVTKSGTNVKIYIDGIDRTGVVTNATFTNNTEPLRIGASQAIGNNQIHGSLDEVAIYPTALSQTRVQAHYDAATIETAPPTYRSLLLADAPAFYWRLEETSGIPQDETSNNLDATIQGTPIYAVAGAYRGSRGMFLKKINNDCVYRSWGPTNTNLYSISMLFKRSKPTNGIHYILQHNGGWMISIEADGTIKVTNTARTLFYVNGGTNKILDKNWHHLVLVRNSTTVKLYLDGVDITVNDTNVASFPGIGTSNILFGSGSPGGSDIVIDECAAFNSVLSPSRILDHYNTANIQPRTPYNELVLADGAVGYWRLGESSGTLAIDESPNGLHGTYTFDGAGALPGLNISGAVRGNSAARFTRSSMNYVTVADNDALDVGDTFSIEFWVRRHVIDTANSHSLVGKAGSFSLYINNVNNTLTFAKHPTTAILTTTATINDTLWHHIVLTKNGSLVKLYLDGVDRTPSIVNQTILNSTNPLLWGTINSVGYSTCDLDECSIYPSVLTLQDAQEHYAVGYPLKSYREEVFADGPHAYWRLGETSGTVANDETSNNLDGFLASILGGVPGPIAGRTALSFSRSPLRYMSMNLAGSYQFNDVWSLEFWMRRNNLGVVASGISDLNSGGWEFTLGDTGSLVLRAYGGTVDITRTDNFFVNDSLWHHVIVTHSGATTKIYVDGVDRGVQYNDAVWTADPTNIFRLGWNDVYQGINADFAECSIYLTALSGPRVLHHYYSALTALKKKRSLVGMVGI